MAKTTIERRVAALEESAGGGRCPECGGPDNFGLDDTYELIWIDPDGPEDREEWCQTCGRQTHLVIRWAEDLS